MLRVLILLLALALAGPVCAFEPQEPIGSWTGSAVLVIHGQDPALRDTVEVQLHLDAFHGVCGTAGGAVFEECRWSSNRGWLLRKLNWKTDWIIKGFLRGSVTQADTVTQRQITVPFNLLEDGTMRGGVMVLHGWRYPFPLFASPGLRLQAE